MAQKSRIQYHLSDVSAITALSQTDINLILRAADEIIFIGGRNILAKILKGSKDKKLLEKQLDRCPAYGKFREYSIVEITRRIDWMIVNDFLQIDYNGRLPMIIFTEKGWLTYKPVYVEELFNLLQSVTDESRKEVLEQLNKTHREVVEMLLSRIGESQNIGFIKILDRWKVTEVKKVQTMINKAINKLKSV